MMAKDFAEGDRVILTEGINKYLSTFISSFVREQFSRRIGDVATIESGEYAPTVIILKFSDRLISELPVLNDWDCLEPYADENWLSDGDVLSLLC